MSEIKKVFLPFEDLRGAIIHPLGKAPPKKLVCGLPNYFARLLVFPESEKDRLTKAIITNPLSGFHLANQCRINPMATSHLSGG